MPSKRLVLDTNLWVSVLITRKYPELEKLLNDKKITLLFSVELMKEFQDVISRPKFDSYFEESDLLHLFNFIKGFSKFIQVKSNVAICRDEKDNFLLNLCIDGKADYLVTGDQDLLVLGRIKKTEILNYSTFVKKLGG